MNSNRSLISDAFASIMLAVTFCIWGYLWCLLELDILTVLIPFMAMIVLGLKEPIIYVGKYIFRRFVYILRKPSSFKSLGDCLENPSFSKLYELVTRIDTPPCVLEHISFLLKECSLGLSTEDEEELALALLDATHATPLCVIVLMEKEKPMYKILPQIATFSYFDESTFKYFLKKLHKLYYSKETSQEDKRYIRKAAIKSLNNPSMTKSVIECIYQWSKYFKGSSSLFDEEELKNKMETLQTD